MSCSIMFAHFKYEFMKIMQIAIHLRGLHSWGLRKSIVQQMWKRLLLRSQERTIYISSDH